MNQEQLIQLQIIENEVEQLEKQLELIEHHLLEMKRLESGLDELEKTEEKEIRAEIGKGIYIPAEIKSKLLIVDVGKGHFVKKNIQDTKKIIKEQIDKLNEAKRQIAGREEDLRKEMDGLIKD